MCELLGISTALPATITMSINRLAARGNPEKHLADGWGVALHDGRDAILIREPEAAWASPWLSVIQNHQYPTRLALAHIRHATQGELSLRNTQPFARELGGRLHVFAHNGNLPALVALAPASGSRFQPIGVTDSEIAFCRLLNRLEPLWTGGIPEVAARLDVIQSVARELRSMGPANFLYTDGNVLFAHADRRTQADGTVVPPGLMMLQRSGNTADRERKAGAPSASGVAIESRGSLQTTIEIASVALTEEAWQPLAQGQTIAVRGGAVIARADADRAGHQPPVSRSSRFSELDGENKGRLLFSKKEGPIKVS